jgi:SAM domain (Sterile alpha motif)
MDIGGWLRSLGLGQYEATFRESEIDAEVLPDLTESDLGQLGVPLGHRKRPLKAIAALGAVEKAPVTACCCYYWAGELTKVLEHADKVLALYDYEKHRGTSRQTSALKGTVSLLLLSDAHDDGPSAITVGAGIRSLAANGR